MSEFYKKAAEAMCRNMLKSADTKSEGMLGTLKYIHSGEAKRKAIIEAEKAEQTFQTLNAKVKDNPMFTGTVQELRENADNARKIAKQETNKATAVKAAPFVMSGVAGGAGAEMLDKSKEKNSLQNIPNKIE